MKRSVAFPLLVMGINSVVIQTILVREFLFSFSGNELTIGLILGSWLLLEAMGCIIGARAAGRPYARMLFILCSGSIIISFPGLVYGLRLIRHILGILPGQTLGMFLLVPVALGSTLVPAIADGIQFAVGSALFPSGNARSAAFSRKVYILEAVGALLGGFILLGVFIAGSATWLIVILTMLLNLTGMFCTVYPMLRNRMRPWYPVLVVMATTLAVIAGLRYGGYAESRILRHQWDGYRIQAQRTGRFGNVTVLKRDRQISVFRNGTALFSSPDPDVEAAEVFVHLSLLSHPDPRQVLVIGNGYDGILDETRKYPLERMDLIVPDPLVAEMADRYVPQGTGRPDFIHRHTGDARQFIRRARTRYDVILVALPPPSSLLLNRFYTDGFYREAAECLAPGGILACRLPGAPGYYGTRQLAMCGTLQRTLDRIFNRVLILPGETVYFLAGAVPVADSLPRARLARSNMVTRFVNDGFIRHRFSNLVRDRFIADVAAVAGSHVNRDLTPGMVMRTTAFWLEQTAFPGRLSFLVQAFLIVTAAVGLILLLRKAAAHPDRRIFASVTATGFCSMALQLLIVLTFQVRAGSLYLYLALLLAAFMAGLAVGALLEPGMPGNTRDHHRLIGPALIILTILTASVVYIPVLDRIWIVTSLFPVLSLLTGMVTGVQYSAAVAITEHDRSGGLLYAADLLGALAASLLIPLVILPWAGAWVVMAMVILVKGVPAVVGLFRRE